MSAALPTWIPDSFTFPSSRRLSDCFQDVSQFPTVASILWRQHCRCRPAEESDDL